MTTSTTSSIEMDGGRDKLNTTHHKQLRYPADDSERVQRKIFRRHSGSGCHISSSNEFANGLSCNSNVISENKEHLPLQPHIRRARRNSLTDRSERSLSERSLSADSSMFDFPMDNERDRALDMIFDDPYTVAAYHSVPLMELERLPRGGISFDTKGVGRIQFGIPPETIKDSMQLGLAVPTVYIVPAERFCREMGPALGINLCEFEFPAYFNYFVRQTQCVLVVDSKEDQQNIRKVFSETLLGPCQFRNHSRPKANEDEDFDSSYPILRRPNFYKEFYHFRTAEASTNYEEFTIDTLLQFHVFSSKTAQSCQSTKLGVPPPLPLNIFTKEVMNQAATNYDSESQATSRLMRSRAESMDHLFHNKKEGLSFSGKQRSFNSHGSSHLTRPRSEKTVNSDRTSASDNFSTGSKQSKNCPYQLKRHKNCSSNDTNNKKGLATPGFWGSAGSMLDSDDEDDTAKSKKSLWTYSQAKWLGNVATVYPLTASEEDRKTTKTARVEIFKMPGGLEYIVHDIDKNNHIIGKVRFSGSVHISDSLVVSGYNFTNEDVNKYSDISLLSDIPRTIAPPTFHPPSFGVTVLGNSHGFDKSGSTSGYVLWINGRGVMIDPPPYSSATLEKEGIRPQMIMAIIVTHCHADHDAGTFQKVMTGSRVAVITTPTIYKSFIRKYSALSGLSPALLRHSHRFRPAIIGRLLQFQGASFDFHYTLHTIPCIAFRVEWRGRSIVFTGDHLNSPPMISRLESEGVLTKQRADDLRLLPLRECDVILHEAGAPPIHTPLSVLLELPEHVRKRLYVVHTSALPDGCPLRVAPTGTVGTIRLDTDYENNSQAIPYGIEDCRHTHLNDNHAKQQKHEQKKLPLISFRPTCVSDAWFILNLLSNVPFLSSLSYPTTMEVLEVSEVKVVSENDVVISAEHRSSVLCVVWEGTLMERVRDDCMKLSLDNIDEDADQSCTNGDSKNSSRSNMPSRHNSMESTPSVWYAGDWTGPIHLQPDPSYAGDANLRRCVLFSDIIAVSSQGAKVIMVDVKYLNQFLTNGSSLFRKYVNTSKQQNNIQDPNQPSSLNSSDNSSYYNYDSETETNNTSTISNDNLLNIIHCNSALRCLTAAQKRHLESLAEGPKYYQPGHFLWCVGGPISFSYLIVSGTAKFANFSKRTPRTRRGSTGSLDVGYFSVNSNKIAKDKQLTNITQNSEYAKLETSLQLRAEEVEAGTFDNYFELLPKEERHRNSRDRFANKALARLHSRKAFTAGLVFSRGHFLSDTNRMVTGSLAFIQDESSNPLEDISINIKDSSHSSSMVAGRDGCVVYAFQRDSLIAFLDANPGVLLSLLGTQVVV